MATSLHQAVGISVGRPASIQKALTREPSNILIEESCPQAMRPFVMNFFRLWGISTSVVTLLCVPVAYTESDWLGLAGVFLVFGAILGH